MEVRKYADISRPDVDYRKLDKQALCALSRLLSDILTKYGCAHAQWQEFSISDASNTIRADFDKFDEYFDNSSMYNGYSLLASGRALDKSKQLNIAVGVEFKYSEPNCHITIISKEIHPAQQTDIIEAIDEFIYEAAKIESPIKSNDTTDNSPANTKNTKPNKKRKFSKKVNAITVAEILAIATALITLVAVVIDKFF